MKLANSKSSQVQCFCWAFVQADGFVLPGPPLLQAPKRCVKIIMYISVFWMLAAACSPQGKLRRQAFAQSSAGMYEDAANIYYNLLLKDPKDKEAKAGLQLNGQKVLGEKFARFSKQVIEGRIDEALRTYHYALGYAQNAAKVGAPLEWPDEFGEVYLDIRNEYTQTQYDLAIDLIHHRKYEQAEKVFERIAQYDSSYRNVSVLRLNTVLEPLYNKGLQQYQAGQFKEAYYSFNRITRIDDQYRDAVKMRNLSQQQATRLVGILPVYYHPAARAFQDNHYSLATRLADELSREQGAYVRIASTSALHKDLENRGFVELNSVEKAIEAGKSTGMSYVVLIEMDSFVYRKSKPEVNEREAYEAVTESILNPYTKTYSSVSKFKRATYTDKSEGQYLAIKITYSLIEVQSGRVLHTDEARVIRNDEIHAAVYNGNPANLYPTLPEGNYLPHVSFEWRQRFSNPRKELIPLPLFINASVDELSARMVQAIRSRF